MNRFTDWKNASYNGANDKEQTMQLQALLKQNSQNVNAVDGTWKDSDNAALKNAGANTFQATNEQKTNYGWVNSGNTVPWYSSEADRVKQNAAHMAKDGIAFNTVTDNLGRQYQTWNPGSGGSFDDITARKKQYGAFGKADSTGGVFNKAGMSSNPYYLQATVGVSRDRINQEAPEIAGLSDLMLQRAYEAGTTGTNQALNFDDYYVTPDGQVGTLAGTEGAVKIGDIRAALGRLTGQQTKMGGGFNAGLSAQFVKPDFYNPYADNSTPVNYGERQKTEVIDPFIQKMHQIAMQGGGETSGTTATTPSTNSNLVQTILRKNRELEENERKYKEGY